MERTDTRGPLPIVRNARETGHGLHGVDRAATLEIDGTRQRIRLRAARKGLPPVLIVQAGPGLPLINEAPKFQQRLRLEDGFTVAYWDQRGCGAAASEDAKRVTLETQVGDARAVIRWLAEETGRPVVVLGISLGATIALRAVAREGSGARALVALSIDTDTAASDAAAEDFLREAAARPDRRHVARALASLGAPPYVEPSPLQARARLLADLGGIERGKRFGELLRGLLVSLVRTYGLIGAVTALRNVNAVQRQLLPEVAKLDLFADWPRPAVPVHYLFGGRDPLMPPSLVRKVSAVAASRDTVATVPDAGHLVHFDEPALVRSVIARAFSTP